MRTSCARRWRRLPRPPSSPRWRWSPGTPRSSSGAGPTRCTSARPGSEGAIPGCASRHRRSSPTTGSCSRDPIGDHGTAIMVARGEFDLAAEIESDSRSLWPVAEALIEAAGAELRCMRDATRGGVASALNELARASGVSMQVSESAVPVRPPVAGAAELLGIDPMQVANEGKLVAFTSPDAAATPWRRCGRFPDARRRPRSVRSPPRHPAWCSSRRPWAADG